MVLVHNDHRVVRWGSPTANAYIVTHPDFPKKYMYITYRMVRLIEKVPAEAFLRAWIAGDGDGHHLGFVSTAESESMPTEVRVDWYKY